MPFIPHTEDEVKSMLDTIGVGSIDDLFDEIPKELRCESLDAIPQGLSEMEIAALMAKRAANDAGARCFIGAGAYDHHIPAAVWEVATRGEFYSAYTPYQAEISQGRLEALLNFQTMVSDLTGLDIANASLLDESTAAAEAMTMAKRSSKSKANVFFVDENCHPQNIAVIRTRAEPLEIEVQVGNPEDLDPTIVFGAIFQYPGTYGHVRDFTDIIAGLHENKALAIISADPLALALLKSPGEMGADIAVHDPYVKHWWELEKQDTYPSPGNSMARFFRNQEQLSEFRMSPGLEEAFRGSDAVIFAVRHQEYLNLNPDHVMKMTGGPVAVVDCFGILDDDKIERYFELGCEVKGLGRGHINRIKDKVRKRKMGETSG